MPAENINQNQKLIRPDSLSICIIVKNEAELLGRCLQSIKAAADEIVVVDTGSTDETIDIAKSNGAKVICTQWRDDFAWARNLSIENANCSWILWLDADDIVPASSIPLLNSLKQKKPDCILGFTVRNQRPNNTGTEFIQARMFPNRADIYFERRIHEQVMPSALRIGMAMEKHHDVVIEHHGYADPETLKRKARRNVNLLIADYNEKEADSITTVEIADSYQLIEDYENAEIWYKKTLVTQNCEKVTPTIAGHAHLGLGNIYNHQEKYAQAIEHLKKALDISPWRPDICYSLAISFEFTSNLDTAIEYLKRILTMEYKAGQVGVDFRTSRLKSYLRLIRILTESEKIGDAAKIVADALEKESSRPEIFNAAGKFFIKCNKLMDALHIFEKSLLLVTDGNIEAYIGLCIIYMRAGAKQKAIETLNAHRDEFLENDRFKAFDAYVNQYDLSQYESTFNLLRREFFNTL